MKKSFTIIAVGLFALMFATGSAMAISGTSITDNTVGTASGGRPALDSINQSPNVILGYNIDPDEFAINGVNSKGVIEYGVASDSSDIYFMSVETGQTAASDLSDPNSDAFGSGYAILGGSS